MKKDDEGEKKKEEAQGYESSGLESDNDLDLLVEQEVLRSQRAQRVRDRIARHQRYAQRGEVAKATGAVDMPLSKEESKKIWDATVANVPEDYDFVVQTGGQEPIEKGAQVYLCYGRMTNREMLKRYGFCLTTNKYNNMFLKLKLETSDPNFKYRHFILEKFFSMEPDRQNGGVNVCSRHFKVHYHAFNTKVLKFVKILTFNVQEDDISCIIETRSLSLEYLSLQKLKKVYEDFLGVFPTTLQEDMRVLRDPKQCSKLSCRQYAAMIFRTEQKRILINQITLVKILMHIIERLMKGMTFEFAVTRIFELESKKDHAINRLMIDNYLTSLQRGMKKNVAAYYKMRGMDPTKGSELLRQTQRAMYETMNKNQYKQFETKGFDQMLERIMQQPMQKAIESGNQELSTKLVEIRQKLTLQAQKNHKIEREVEDYVVKTNFADELNDRLTQMATENGEKLDQGKDEKKVLEKKESENKESEEESSYYDDEEDDE